MFQVQNQLNIFVETVSRDEQLLSQRAKSNSLLYVTNQIF